MTVKQRYDNVGPLAGLSYPQASNALQSIGGQGLQQSVSVIIPKNMTPPVGVAGNLPAENLPAA